MAPLLLSTLHYTRRECNHVLPLRLSPYKERLFPAFRYLMAGRQIGDDSSTVHCFDIKRGEAQLSFSSRLANSNGNRGSGRSGAMVTAVAMGGNSCGLGGGDRVFATQVRS